MHDNTLAPDPVRIKKKKKSEGLTEQRHGHFVQWNDFAQRGKNADYVSHVAEK